MADTIEALVGALDCERSQVTRICVYLVVCLCAMLAKQQMLMCQPLLVPHESSDSCQGYFSPSQAVRSAIVSTMPLTDETLETLLERTMDVSDEVRVIPRLLIQDELKYKSYTYPDISNHVDKNSTNVIQVRTSVYRRLQQVAATVIRCGRPFPPLPSSLSLHPDFAL